MKISANLWYKATRFYRRILAPAIVLLLTIIVTVLPLGFGGGVASAAVGGTLATLLPSPSGNGRAVTIDPTEGHLYYTNYGDPHIYVIDTSGTALQTLNPLPYSGGLNIMYGALSWQSTSTGGILWGGRYDGSGWVDQINPNTGRITPAFRFSFPAGDSCYSQGTGYIDGLAYDGSDNTLWLGDDASHTIFHVTTDGSIIKSYTTPNGLCRSGITASKGDLLLGLQQGPDTPPYQVGRVSKSDPTTLLQTISISGGGPEGLALDSSTFPGKCALWTNQFGSSTVLTARELPFGLCQGLPVFSPLPKPTLRSVGLLTFHIIDKNHQPEILGCVATVINSANSSTIVTAAHCVVGAAAFGSTSKAIATNLEFAPAHTGQCWTGTYPNTSPNVDVDNCGNNPYGVWYANSTDVYFSPSYVPCPPNNTDPNCKENTVDDYAFIVVRPHGNGQRVQQAVGGFNITYDTNTDPATDPLQSQTWVVSSYAADDPRFVSEAGGFGPYQCDWIGSTNGTSPSSSRLGATLDHACSFTDPITGVEQGMNYPSDLAAAFGSSGSPWTNDQNSPDHSVTIGAIEAGAMNNCNGSDCIKIMQGTKFGTDAAGVLANAEATLLR